MQSQETAGQMLPHNWEHLPFADPGFMRWWLESHTLLPIELRAQVAHHIYNAIQVKPAQEEVSSYLLALGYQIAEDENTADDSTFTQAADSAARDDFPQSKQTLIQQAKGLGIAGVWQVIADSLKRLYQTRPVLIYLLVIVAAWTTWSALSRLGKLFASVMG
jgi:hypothetical protein